nr:RHS repeat-associated core domain-containing protein [Dysgonomonas sp. ZJ709]
MDGEIVQHIEYVPFGEVFIEERNNKWNTPFLFNAKELDEETGLYYYGARYYDPRTSVWISTDPLQEKYPNISTYAYTFQNPIKFIDPTGMEGEASNGDKSPKRDLDFKGVLGKAKDDFLRMIGLHPDQVNPENVNASSRETLEASRKTHEEGKERRKATLETIDSANETMLMFVPFGEVAYKAYRGKTVTLGDVGIEIAGIIPIGKVISKGGKVIIIYRAVSKAELDDIAKYGLRTVETGYDTGKLFAPTLEEAAKFGKNNFHFDKLPTTIIQVEVPIDIMNKSTKFGADGMNAISISSDQLYRLKVTPLNYSPIVK